MRKQSLTQKYPPSPPCSCEECLSYCRKPGWWTVEKAAAALDAGFGGRMMLEMEPGNALAVLSPAFRGNQQQFAAQEFSGNGCTFLVNERCELHGTGHQPPECRSCHHARAGEGPRWHADIEKQWNGAVGRARVVRWSNAPDFWKRLPTGHHPGAAVHGLICRVIENVAYGSAWACAFQEIGPRPREGLEAR